MHRNQTFFVLGASLTAALLAGIGISTARSLPHSTVAFAGGSMCIQEKQSANGGCLFSQTPKGEKQVFPLKHTDVNARITGNLARVEVTQTFENPYNDPLEAIYTFPLPDQAAVDEMEIKIGDRVIRGNIKRREEAQKIYQDAKRNGQTAGLLEQQRDNIFTQSLANIRPGEKIQVKIRYTESVKFEKGDYEFVFPMVVGPRYIPGQTIGTSVDTDRVPDASKITPPVIKPGTRSGQDIAVNVEIDAGVPLQTVQSTSHKLRIQSLGGKVQVKLGGEDTIPNKDLVLRYRVSNKNTQATVLTEKNHFATYLIPALTYSKNEIVPKDVVFLMDTSGSQSGDPIVKSQELMRRFINGLNPQDTFTIIDFSDTTHQLSATPLTNTPENRALALAYIDKVDANGGTELLNGIHKALSFPATEEGRLRSIVLLTDGYIGDDKAVIAEVQRHLKPGNRFYAFGVGSSVNRFLIDRLGELGRGTSQVIRQDEPSKPVADKFFRQIANPVLTNIQVTWEGTGSAPEIYPKALPDLFANQPLVLYGRKSDKSNGVLKITGTTANGGHYEERLNVQFSENGNPAIAQLWGRARIKDLANQMYGGDTKTGVDAITQTALKYHLLSDYTAFVAVSDEVRVDGNGVSRTVQVPVELPQGVNDEAQEEVSVSSRRRGTVQPAPVASTGFAVRREDITATGATSTLPETDANKPTKPASPTEPVQKSEQKKDKEIELPPLLVKIASAPQLSAIALEDLNRRLSALQQTTFHGKKVVFDAVIQNGRVTRLVLVEEASTLSNPAALALLRRSLVSWVVPDAPSTTTRITLNF
jgi:Ca-activated chloride channel homolog